MIRLAAIAGLAAALLAVSAAPAGACSCARLKPRTLLAGADAAFVGKVRGKKLLENDDRRVGDVYRYRIRVGKSLKHRLGRFLRIEARNDSAACGFEWDKGDRVAAYLYGKPGAWQTSLCSLESPRTMRRLARALAEESVNPRRLPRSPRSTCR